MSAHHSGHFSHDDQNSDGFVDRADTLTLAVNGEGVPLSNWKGRLFSDGSTIRLVKIQRDHAIIFSEQAACHVRVMVFQYRHIVIDCCEFVLNVDAKLVRFAGVICIMTQCCDQKSKYV